MLYIDILIILDILITYACKY